MAVALLDTPISPSVEEDIQELRRLSQEEDRDSLHDYFREVYARHGVNPELARWKEVLTPSKLRVFLASQPERNLLPDFNWIMAHSERYRGEWLALQSGQLLAHGPDYDQVVSEAQDAVGGSDFLMFAAWRSAVPIA
jgi:hypothetical protein